MAVEARPAEGRTFQQTVHTLTELREIIGEPSAVVRRKVIPRLDEHCRSIIARSPFLLIGTSNAEGQCDVSPKGDTPGFVRILDDNTIVIPDRSGNKRIDSLSNILENPRVGLLFLIPGMEETLRINGRAQLVRDPELLASMTMQGKTPLVGIAVHVEEAYMHCARSFKRARLWDQSAWMDRSTVPSLAKIVMDQAQVTECTLEELEAVVEEGNRNLY